MSPAAAADPVPLAVVSSTGVCPDGAPADLPWPGNQRPGGPSFWGSDCKRPSGAAPEIPRVQFQDFLAPAALQFYLSGAPRAVLTNAQSGEQKVLPVTSKTSWQMVKLPVPSGWVGKRVQLALDTVDASAWLAFTSPLVPAAALSLPPIDTASPQTGFCPNGVYTTTKWPSGGRPPNLVTRGSYCKGGDKDLGWAASPPILARSNVNLYVAGYPDKPGLLLAVENLDTAEQLPLHISNPPMETWQLRQFPLPPNWNGHRVRIIARDQSFGLGGWLAFSDPLPPTAIDLTLDHVRSLVVVLLLASGLLFASAAAALFAVRKGIASPAPLAAIALLIAIAGALTVRSAGFVDPLPAIGAGLLAALVIAAECWHTRQHGLRSFWTTALQDLAIPPSRRRLLFIIWGCTAAALLPAIFRWPAPPPFADVRDLLLAIGYLAAAAVAWLIYNAERKTLPRVQALSLAVLAVLLTVIINHLHAVNVDSVSFYHDWQNYVQNAVLQYRVEIPHAYRFLPNSIVRWVQIAGLDFDDARDLYRLIVGMLVFYAIYRFARLYTGFLAAILAMLIAAALYPISFEYYMGQLTDPLSHLSFLLAFIFLETEEFALLLTTLLIGSLAKETVLALSGYYVLFHRKERGYPAKAAILCLGSAGIYFGVRLFVLHGVMTYHETSGVGLDQVEANLVEITWRRTFPLVACSLFPFLLIAWKQTPLCLKRLAIFLLPVLFLSSLFFSWLREARNFMPLVFVLAVVTGSLLAPGKSRTAVS